MTESNRARPTRGFGAYALFLALGVLAACAIALSWMRIALEVRRSAVRETELDEWAYSGAAWG